LILVATQLKVGMLIKWEGNLCSVIHLEHRTPGNWRGMVHAKLRNIATGSQMENRFRTDEKVEKADVETHEMEFLYADATDCHFMNTENYEQVAISKEVLGDTFLFMTPNVRLKISFYEARPVGTELPDKVDLEVVETEPALKGATVSNVTKPAKLETGLVVQVPPFIAPGERIRVDTRDGEYVERV
jgi:elongation factor P